MNMGTQYSTPQSANDNQISGRYDSKHRGSKFDINDQSLNQNNITTATMNRQSRTNTDKEYGDFVDKFEKEFGKRMPIVDNPAQTLIRNMEILLISLKRNSVKGCQ